MSAGYFDELIWYYAGPDGEARQMTRRDFANMVNRVGGASTGNMQEPKSPTSPAPNPSQQ
jgi:hypothetical protein